VTELIFVGQSPEGEILVFMDEDGHEYHAQIDEHIRESVTVRARVSEVPERTTGITPRDIQTRIRRGESVTDIASEAGVEEQRIERFAGPVLAERAHQARRAAATVVKRKSGEETLENIVVRQLELHDIDCSELIWDSWRRDDGRWSISLTWNVGSGIGMATWVFDPKSQSVIAADDQARWIFEDSSAVQGQDPVRPRLVGLPIQADADDSDQDSELEPPAWAGPGHPTMPVPLGSVTTDDDSPSWDDILFGQRPTDS